MGRWPIIPIAIATCLTLATAAPAQDAEFKHVGDFLLKSHFKIVGGDVTPIPMKPIAFRVFTNGVTIRVSTEDNEDAHLSFTIYRSDGISRQKEGGGALEIIPGVQATTKVGGVLRHLRLTEESMTITTFPGVSNQTIVSHSIAAEPIEPKKKPSNTTEAQP